MDMFTRTFITDHRGGADSAVVNVVVRRHSS
jgi:hypothetical protein